MKWSVAGLLILTMPLAAAAHGDQRLVDERLEIPAGASATFTGDVHYHRLVGTFTASSAIDVTLLEPGRRDAILSTGASTDISVNELIECCDGASWTEYLLVIDNPGDEPVEVSAKASLVHDDLAVTVYRAESGVVGSMLVLGGLWSFAIWRRRRKGVASTRTRALAAAVVVSGAAVTLGAYGTLRYGTGGVPGLLAGLADVPIVPLNPIVSRASLLLFLGMAGWAVAGARWASVREQMAWSAWIAHGLVLSGMVVAVAWLVSTTYATSAIPAMTAALALAPVSVVMAVESRKSLGRERVLRG